MPLSRMSKKARALSLAAAGMAVAALAGGMAVMSTSAQADTGTCGLLKANVIGRYDYGSVVGLTELELNNDNTVRVSNDVVGPPLEGTWAFQDSAIIVTVPDGNVRLHLIPQCAGVKLRPEALLGFERSLLGVGGAFYRDAT